MRHEVCVALSIVLGGQSFLSEAQTATSEPVNQALACNLSLPTRPELAPLTGKVMVSSEPKATLEMQADISKPTATEKAAISQWVKLREGCFDLGNAWMDAINAPRWLRSIVMQSKDASDAIASALYRGELTYGEFNVKQIALAAETRRRVDDGIELARREEGAGRQIVPAAPTAAKPTFAQDRSQCEMDAARAYPVLMQQRMTNPGYQQPAPTEVFPQQTNCSVVGGEFVCRKSGIVFPQTPTFNQPPSYISEDINEGRRVSAFSNCMEAKGYRRK